MARKILKFKKYLKDGSFLDIQPPNFSWIKIDLQQIETRSFFDDENLPEKTTHDFQINLNLSKQMNTEDKNLSSKVQEICKLNFAPYYWKEKSYKYYTSDKTGTIEEKKLILKNLLNLFYEYDQTNKNIHKDSIEAFENDSKNDLYYDTPELILKFHKPTNRFIVLAKGAIGSEQFKILINASEYSENLLDEKSIFENNQNPYLITNSFFDGKFKNKKYFIINPNYYINVKNHFLQKIEENHKFKQEQSLISQTINYSEFEITEDNPFDLKILFNKDDQCFDFYGKGYFEPAYYNGKKPPRTLLGKWALNFIYSTEVSSTENSLNPEDYIHDSEIIVDKYKINLKNVPGGSKKEKNIKIPFSEWEKLKKIKELYKEEMKVWGRTIKNIKITHCDFSNLNIFSFSPSVYIDSKGNCYLSFSSRKTGMFRNISSSIIKNDFLDYELEETQADNNLEDKKKKNTKFSITLKSIPISFEEAIFFLEEHPFSQYIKTSSAQLNSIIHNNDYSNNQEDIKKSFETILLMAEIASKSNKKESSNKKIKI